MPTHLDTHGHMSSPTHAGERSHRETDRRHRGTEEGSHSQRWSRVAEGRLLLSGVVINGIGHLLYCFTTLISSTATPKSVTEVSLVSRNWMRTFVCPAKAFRLIEASGAQ